jgi:sugar O-acyltransferase (sialic acid O-acetyltransferase NeuD family)
MDPTDKIPLVIVGAGGHARVILDIAQSLDHPVFAFVDKRKAVSAIDGIPVVGSIHELSGNPEGYEFVVGIGDNFIRARAIASLIAVLPEIRFATLVHPSATIARSCLVDIGTVVMAAAVVNPGSRIGKHCIVNTQASIDHDNEIGNFVSLAPRSVTGGNVVVADYSAICLGASVVHGAKIGKHSIVGAGAVVLKDIPEFSVAIGVPARISRKRTAGEPYL